jgi:hypothetical protein
LANSRVDFGNLPSPRPLIGSARIAYFLINIQSGITFKAVLVAIHREALSNPTTAMAPLKKRHIASILILFLLGAAVYGLLPEPWMGSRDLGCDKQTGRAQEICRRLEREMQWTWMGHAIISPGWRVTFKSIARTYCAERVGPEDTSALQTLRQTSRDWRAERGADFLTRLVENKDEAGGENNTSIFNRTNPSFILKDGCLP